MDKTLDKNDPASWFDHEFGPFSAVADYANDPPRGMNNPPMNLKLRKILCKDLVEYGLELQVPEWGTGFVRSTSSAPTSPADAQERRLARINQSRQGLMQSYTEKLRTGRVLKSGSIFSRSAPAFPTRQRRSECLVSAQEEPPPEMHPDWHQYHPFPNTLRPIDKTSGPACLKTPSASSGSQARGIQNAKEKRGVRFAEDAGRTLSDHINYQGSPVNFEFIKTPCHEKAIQMGKRMALDASGKRTMPEAPGIAKKSADSGKEGAKSEDAKQNRDDGGKIDNRELDNRMRSLRGMSQLHRAAVADRFRFGASASAGEPMVLRASSLSQACPGCWSSDSSFLNKFHNSAIRIVDPSGLQVLKEPTSKRKKKKQKQKQNKDDDEEELQMSESSVFVARYPIDQSLVALRRARKKAFPESEEDTTPKGPTQEEIQRTAASSLKMEFPGCLLSRVRESEEDKLAQEKAIRDSGYDVDYGI